LGESSDCVELLATDYLQADLSGAEKAMLDFAKKLTVSPNLINQNDVEQLRSAGWDDRSILDITLVTSYFNFVNRIALGLGVELEQ
jgi:uncharacterized peroxidase-related enzyme